MTELISRGVDGVILALGSYSVGDFSGLNLPMVYAGDILSVSYRSAIFDMVSAFHDCGHKRIAFLSGLPMSSPSHIRYQNFKEALTYYHMESDEALFVDGDGYTDEESGYAAADRLLSRGVEFTGLFAVNDLMAMGAMKRLWEAGLSIPGDVSLAGCDGIKSSAYTIPPLSTIQCHSFTIGSCLMYELLFKLHPERYASCTGKVIEAEFVRRESLGRAAN
jgi:LacI family transcriptional regulator